MVVRDRQQHTGQPPRHQVAREPQPGGPVLGCEDGHPEHLLVTIPVHHGGRVHNPAPLPAALGEKVSGPINLALSSSCLRHRCDLATGRDSHGRGGWVDHIVTHHPWHLRSLPHVCLLLLGRLSQG